MSESKSGRHITFFNARLTSTISISLVLFILGIVVLMGILATRLSMYVKENMGFSIVLKENVKESQVKKLQKKLDIAPYVRATQYISKEDALKELEVELGENPKDLLGFNPLQASIEVKLRSDYAHPDSLVWIEKGLRKGTVAIDDIVYQKAAYVAFDSNQRKELWLSKLQETLKLDWTNAEKEHISKLIYLIEDNSNLFDNKVSVDDKTDLAIYQWKEYALEQLRWDHELIFSIIKTPEKLNANKKLDTSLYKTPATKNNSESDGNKQPLCNCNSNESHKWFLCSLWFHKCHIGVCEVRSKDCGDLWLYECNGLCV